MARTHNNMIEKKKYWFFRNLVNNNGKVWSKEDYIVLLIGY